VGSGSSGIPATVVDQARRYGVEDAAKLTGITAARLRIWEARYGWPRPQRDPHNGYRLFSDADIAELIKVKAHLASGHRLMDLIDDNGCLRVIAEERPGPDRATVAQSVYDLLPEVETLDGRSARAAIVRAIKRGDGAAVVQLLHEAWVVHPSDRVSAVLIPVAVWFLLAPTTQRSAVQPHLAKVAGDQLHVVNDLAEGAVALWRAEEARRAEEAAAGLPVPAIAPPAPGPVPSGESSSSGPAEPIAPSVAEPAPATVAPVPLFRQKQYRGPPLPTQRRYGPGVIITGFGARTGAA
jgi:MerR HTH family regulatory protein